MNSATRRPTDGSSRGGPWPQTPRRLSFKPSAGLEAPEAQNAPRTPLVFWADPEVAAIEGGMQMLRRNGFEVRRFDTIADVEAALEAQSPSLLILETVLPGEDPLALCGRLSAHGGVPIMLCSAIADTLDRVAGLDCGADEYLDKSAHPLELLARARALLRRARRGGRPASEVDGAWSLDMLTGLLSGPSGKCVRLSPSEAALLGIFSERPNEILYRAMLMQLLHGEAAAGLTPRLVDTRVARLRKALDACDAGGEMIRTLRGGGYLFHARVTQPPA